LQHVCSLQADASALLSLAAFIASGAGHVLSRQHTSF
jgi:hypothetical protein